MNWDQSVRDWWRWMHQNKVFTDIKWRGRICVQNPLDLWMLAQLCHDDQIQNVIELGTWNGGTAHFLKDVLGYGGHIYTIDRNPCDLSVDGVTVIQGDYRNADIAQRLWSDLLIGRTMVIDD